MKKITLLGVLQNFVAARQTDYTLEMSAGVKYAVAHGSSVAIPWLPKDLLPSSMTFEKNSLNGYWIGLENYLSNGDCTITYLHDADLIKRADRITDNSSMEDSMTHVRINYVNEVQLYSAMIEKLKDIPDETVVILPYSFAEIFYEMHDSNEYSITEFIIDDLSNIASYTNGPSSASMLIMSRFKTLSAVGKFLDQSPLPEPDFTGSWGKNKNGEFSLYITDQNGSKVSGVIMDRLGPASFTGTLNTEKFTFVKTYMPEVQALHKIEAVINYAFENELGFIVETEGVYSTIGGSKELAFIRQSN